MNLLLISILSIQDFALFSFGYSFSNILVSILPFGSSVFLIAQDLNKEENNFPLQQSFIITIVLFSMVLGSYIGLTTFFDTIKGWEMLLYGLILSFILSLNLVLFSFFKGLGKFNVEMIAYGIFSICLLGFIGVIYLSPTLFSDVRGIFSFLIFLNLSVFIGTIILTRKRTKVLQFSTYNFSFMDIKESFLKRKYFGLQEIITAIYTQVGLLILFYVLDEITYGYYRALFVIVMPFFMITVAIAQVLLNRMKTLYYEFDVLMKYFRRAQVFTIGLGFLICVLLFFLKDLVFNYIELPDSALFNISYYIIILIVIIRFIFSNYEMLLVVLDKQKQRFFVMLFSAIISVLLIFMILPESGLVGAVLINAISYVIVLIGTLYLSEVFIKHTRKQ